jgi:hypothetical protein
MMLPSFWFFPLMFWAVSVVACNHIQTSEELTACADSTDYFSYGLEFRRILEKEGRRWSSELVYFLSSFLFFRPSLGHGKLLKSFCKLWITLQSFWLFSWCSEQSLLLQAITDRQMKN